MKTYKLITKKTGSGHFKVTIFNDLQEVGTFDTTDMQLIDDIQEVNIGCESELMMHDNFNEVIETCLDLSK